MAYVAPDVAAARAGASMNLVRTLGFVVLGIVVAAAGAWFAFVFLYTNGRPFG